MATIVNRRDVILQAATTRVAGVTMAPNLQVDPSQVTGLGLVIIGTKSAEISASSQIFQVASSGTSSPASINLSGSLRNIVGTPSLTVLSGTITPPPVWSGGPSAYTANIPYTSMSTDTVRLRLSVTESSITYTDDITIVKVFEGSSSIGAFLTNESHTVPGDSVGNVLNYSGSGGTFKLYQGATDITSLCTYAILANPSSLTASINATTGVYSVTGGYPTGTTTTTLTFRATFGSLTFDRVFTLTKATVASTGTPGQRGSRTFYVTLAGSTATYSDSLATTTASVSGGPVINDVVTQSNSSVGFSQTKFWDGSVWQIVNAVVDGNLLVSGTVGATAIAANSIRTSHLLVATSGGRALNADPQQADISAYVNEGGGGATIAIATLTDGVSGSTALRLISSGTYAQASTLRYAITAGRVYRITAKVRRISGSGAFYLRMACFNAAGATVTYALTSFPAAVPNAYEGFTVGVGTSWTTIQGTIQAGSATTVGRLEFFTNYPSGSGTCEIQDWRCEEQIDASMVVAGSLTADRIDTRQLDIKDAAGNVIFSSGTNLDIARIQNSYRVQNNLVDSSFWSPSVAMSAIPSSWVVNGALAENSFVFGAGARGQNTVLWRAQAGASGSSYNDADGGWDLVVNNIDSTKTYRFAIPIKRESGTGTFFLGPAVSSVCNLNTTTVSTNPYFAIEANIPINQWVLFVGYVYPAGTTGASNAGAGIYNLNTGANITSSGVNFTWVAGATLTVLRTYQYYGGLNSTGYFDRPLLHVVDGTEPSLNEYFNLSTAVNATVDVQLVGSAGVMIRGNTVTRASTTPAWDQSVYSTQGYIGGAYASLVPAATTQDFIFGLNSDPTTDNSYVSIDYAMQVAPDSNLYVYESNVYQGAFGAFAAGDVLSVTYDGSNVRYLRNGTVFRTVLTTANRLFYFDSSLFTPGVTLTNVKFGPYGNPSAVQPTNPITSSNVTTYISAAAIGDLQIGNFIKSTGFNGTIDGSGNITAVGTAGWAISKGGVAVFDAASIRGQLTVQQIQIQTAAVATVQSSTIFLNDASGDVGSGGGLRRQYTDGTPISGSTGLTSGVLVGSISIPVAGQSIGVTLTGSLQCYFHSSFSGPGAGLHTLEILGDLYLYRETSTNTYTLVTASSIGTQLGIDYFEPGQRAIRPLNGTVATTNAPAGNYVAVLACGVRAYNGRTTTTLYALSPGNGSFNYRSFMTANAV